MRIESPLDVVERPDPATSSPVTPRLSQRCNEAEIPEDFGQGLLCTHTHYVSIEFLQMGALRLGEVMDALAEEALQEDREGLTISLDDYVKSGPEMSSR